MMQFEPGRTAGGPEGCSGQPFLAIALQPLQLGADMDLHIVERGDAVDQVARHRLRQFVPDEKMQAAHLRREIDDRLPRRVAAADQRDLFPGAETRLDRRGPVVDAPPLIVRQRGNARPPIACPGGDHHRTGADPTVVRHFQQQGIAPIADQALHFGGNRDLRPELDRLVEGPPRQRLTGYAGGKAEIVLDPRRSARLPAHDPAVQYQDREPFRSAIDRRCQPGWPRADDRDIENALRIERPRQSQASCHLRIAGTPQHGTVGADHQRYLFRGDPQPFQQGTPLVLARGIEDHVGIAAAGEEILQAHDIGLMRVADQDRARRALSDKPDAPQDQGTHHQFTDIRRSDHQPPQ
ncbi:hypothetical protein COLO4_01820, partial [Corchorus olitorius]